jgi:hypothetical protein
MTGGRRPESTWRQQIMVLTVTDHEFIDMKRAIMDADQKEALRILREFVKRLEHVSKRGVKSHLE